MTPVRHVELAETYHEDSEVRFIEWKPDAVPPNAVGLWYAEIKTHGDLDRQRFSLNIIDPKFVVPATIEWDWRFNDTNALSPLELVRSVVVGAVCAQILAAGDGQVASAVGQILEGWCKEDAREVAAITNTARYAAKALWGDELRRHTAIRHHVMHDLVRRGKFRTDLPVSPFAACALRTSVTKVGALIPRYEGPPNIRALVADLPVGQRELFQRLAQKDKSVLSLILCLLIQVDGQTDRRDIIRSADLDGERPVDLELAHTLVDTLIASGWVEEA